MLFGWHNPRDLSLRSVLSTVCSRFPVRLLEFEDSLSFSPMFLSFQMICLFSLLCRKFYCKNQHADVERTHKVPQICDQGSFGRIRHNSGVKVPEAKYGVSIHPKKIVFLRALLQRWRPNVPKLNLNQNTPPVRSKDIINWSLFLVVPSHFWDTYTHSFQDAQFSFHFHLVSNRFSMRFRCGKNDSHTRINSPDIWNPTHLSSSPDIWNPTHLSSKVQIP